MPLALITGAAEKEMKTGEKVLLTAFGSGLNSIFTGLVW
jgi:3-oxoacyl-[acyl-carrier-protein] synthase III